MNDDQLNKLLKKAEVPKRSKQYEKAFPKKVVAAIRQLASLTGSKARSRPKE